MKEKSIEEEEWKEGRIMKEEDIQIEMKKTRGEDLEIETIEVNIINFQKKNLLNIFIKSNKKYKILMSLWAPLKWVKKTR